jgi:uncharacterized protein YggE
MKRFTPLYLAALLLPGLALAGDWPAYPFVHANASASVYVVPDTVTIAFDIVAVQADPQLAMQQVDTSIAAIRALVDGLGDKDATTEIQELRKTEKPAKAAAKPDEPTAPAEPLHEVKAAIIVTVRDMAVWRPLVTGLIGMRELESPFSTFSNTQQAQIETDLMAQALRKARLKADSIASGLGRKIDSVGAASSGNLSNLTNAIGIGPQDQQRTVTPGRVNGPLRTHLDAPALRFSQSVDAVFRLK